ncbi:MAG: glycosyltransferase family 4 protein [Candidatus Gastranaerophilales bacterium]|nr:glycosyltransferase family 4 protein [Candidatus Gastranaerophilales bacterium]
MSEKRIAIISDQLAGGIGGAESITFSAVDLYPQADFYTTVYNPDIIPAKYRDLKINTTFIQHLPFAKKKYKAYFPIMPLAVEYLNMQQYDVIFSSHHSVAKGVITKPEAVHICYCHSPARYIWDLFWTYSDLNRFNGLTKVMVAAISQYLRMWDVTSAQRVDHFLSNSKYTALRIKKFYGRDSEVLYPPVDTQKFRHEGTEDYYFMLGRLVAYKGFELAVDAFNESGKRLVIAGYGPEYEKLRKKAKSNIEMPGKIPEADVIRYMNNCRGFLFPGKEDFGIVMVEAQSAGKPVIAFQGGGALDIIRDEETGILFNEQTSASLNEAIKLAEKQQWDHNLIMENAQRFDKNIFNDRLKNILDNSEDYKR